MVDSIAPGGDGQANHTLAIWRADRTEGDLMSDITFLPGMELHADPALEISGRYNSPEGRLFEFDLHTGPRPGGWVGLHLSLPVADLRGAGVLGFAARFAGPQVEVVRACLRSGVEGGFEDCFFDKHLLFRPEEASHVDALQVHQRDRLPLQAPWRELVFFLPTQAFRLSLIDLRVFVV